MNDTLPEMEERYRGMLMQRTGAERLIMGCAMRDTTQAFAEASLREQSPEATEADIRKGLLSPLLRTRIRYVNPCQDFRSD